MNTTRPTCGLVEDRHRPELGDLEQRAAPTGAPTMDGPRLRGLIPYGVPSSDLGGWTEVIEPGALRNARLDGLVATVDHGGVPIARHPGTLTVEDRDDAFHWSLELPESRSDVKEAVTRRDLCAGSWRMVVARDEWRGSTRHVHEIAELRDVSVVSSPAYAASVVEHRSAPAAPPAGPTPGPAPRVGTLRVEDRQATSARPVEARVLDAIRSVRRGESRSLTTAEVDAVEPDDLRTAIIDRLRERSVLVQSGAVILTTDKKAIRAPMLTTDVEPAFYNELETIAEGDPGFDEFTVPVKAIKHRVVASNEAIEDSDPSLLQAIIDNLNVTLALKGDREMLVGNAPKGFPGLLNIAGVQTLAVDGPLSWDDVLRAVGLLGEANVPGAAAVYMPPRVQTGLDLGKEATGSNAYLGRPANVPPVFTTGWLPITAGADPTATVIVAVPSQLSVVVRRAPTVEIDRSVGFDEDATHIRGRYRLGFGVAHPQAVIRLTGVAAPAIT